MNLENKEILQKHNDERETIGRSESDSLPQGIPPHTTSLFKSKRQYPRQHSPVKLIIITTLIDEGLALPPKNIL